MSTTQTIAGDCPIHVEMHGDIGAPCIVMILGLGMQVSEWPQDLIDSLARDFRVLCIENRDIGRSGRTGPDIDPAATARLQVRPVVQDVPYTLFDMRDDVLRCAETLGIRQFAVVGFSMGGMIAQLVAAKLGARARGLVQICSSAGEAEMPAMPDAWARFLRTSRPFASENELVDWLAEDLIWWSDPTPLSASDARATALNMIRGGFSSGGYARQLLAINGSGDRTPALRSIVAPTLIIAGRQDRCLAPQSSERAHALIPNSELVFHENMGHALDSKAMHQLATWLRETHVSRSTNSMTHAGGRT